MHTNNTSTWLNFPIVWFQHKHSPKYGGLFYYFREVPKVQIVAYTTLMCLLKTVCASFMLDGLCYQ